MSQTYPCLYQIIPRTTQPATKEEIDKMSGSVGGCDAVIIHSLIFPEDGSRSEMMYSFDGKTGKELPDMEFYKSWIMMANKLMDSPTLPTSHKELARIVFEAQRRAILDARRKAGTL